LAPVQLTSRPSNFDQENDLEDKKTQPKKVTRLSRSRNSEDSSKSDGSEEKDASSVSLVSLLFAMINESNNPAMRVVAAECCAKLMFSGKLHDANLVAELIVMYFDRDFVVPEEEVDRDDAKEVGSPVRLQQLLTLFFPAYSFRSKLGRDTLMTSIKPMLSIIYKKMKLRVRGKRAYAWPIIRMVEYICNNVERGEDQAVEEKETDSKQLEEGEAEILDSGQEEKAGNDCSTPSPVLLLSISISEFLTENGSALSLSFLRSLCKILHGVNLDLESENIESLNKLVKNMDNLAMIITDAVAIRSLENLYDVLGEIHSRDEMATDDITEEEDVSDLHYEIETEDNQRKGSLESTGNKENIVEDESNLSEDDFYNEKDVSLAIYPEDKENSIYAALTDALTPIKKKSRSSQSPLAVEPEFSPPKNKRKTYTPIQSATKPRATVRRRKDLSDSN